MRQSLNRVVLSVLTLACVVFLAGCPAKSPEEQIAEARSQYTVQLNTWAPRDPEVVVEEALEGEAEGAMAGAPQAAAEAAGAAEAAVAAEAIVAEGEEAAEGEGEMDMEMESGPKTRPIFFDLIVRFDGYDALPGLTVDITHADAFEKEKAVYRQWLDTSGMAKSDTRQIDFILDDIAFEEGDVFSVQLRSNIPAEERGDYQEFAAAGP